MPRSTLRCLGVVALLVLTMSSGCSDRRSLDLAEEAARQWLALVDAGKYERSWEEASPQLKRRQPKDAWVRITRDARAVVPGAAQRVTYDRFFHTRLGDGPEGQYVNLSLRLLGKDGRGLGELLTMVKGDDGAWRVYGYRTVGGESAAK